MRQLQMKRIAMLLILGMGAGLMGSWLSLASAQNSTTPTEAKTTAKEPSSAKQATTTKTGVTKKGEKKFSGRLPVYYGEIVSGDQKEKIYAIQMSYADKLDELVSQVKELQAKQAAEIEAVLTPEQKKQLDELRAEAAAKRKSRAAQTATATEAKPAAK